MTCFSCVKCINVTSKTKLQRWRGRLFIMTLYNMYFPFWIMAETWCRGRNEYCSSFLINGNIWRLGSGCFRGEILSRCGSAGSHLMILRRRRLRSWHDNYLVRTVRYQSLVCVCWVSLSRDLCSGCTAGRVNYPSRSTCRWVHSSSRCTYWRIRCSGWCGYLWVQSCLTRLNDVHNGLTWKLDATYYTVKIHN